jgi:hypothetical protein
MWSIDVLLGGAWQVPLAHLNQSYVQESSTWTRRKPATHEVIGSIARDQLGHGQEIITIAASFFNYCRTFYRIKPGRTYLAPHCGFIVEIIIIANMSVRCYGFQVKPLSTGCKYHGNKGPFILRLWYGQGKSECLIKAKLLFKIDLGICCPTSFLSTPKNM